MAGYRLSDEQREVLDRLLFESVKGGDHRVDDICKWVGQRLVQRQELWATGLARLHNFKHYVKSGLNRLKKQGLLSHENQNRVSWWLLPSQAA